MATHWTQLAPMVVCGAIGDIAIPLMQSHLAQHAGAQRVRAFALVFNIGPAIAFGLSPLIAGPLIAQFGMRAAFLYAAVCTVFSILFLSRLAPAPRQSAPQESSRRSYRVALAEPAIPLLLILQFATIFALAAGILLMPLFLAEARGISPALIAILGGIGSIGAVLFGLAVARSEWLQRRPLTAITIGIAMVLGTLAVVLATHVVWLIALAFVGRGGLWSTWSLYAGALGEVVRRERLRTRVFALSEMIGGTAYATAPVLSGQLYAIRPEIPLVASLAASAALIPVLLVAQRRLLPDRPHLGAAKAPVAVTALIDSEAV
jgi:MFS family permease